MQRKTTQELAPSQHQATPAGQYDVYPAFPLADGKINTGFEALAQLIASKKQLVIDGYVGVFWDDFREKLGAAFDKLGINPQWIDVSSALHEEERINALVAPFLGGDDPIFGTRFTGQLVDFYNTEKLQSIPP